MSTNKSVKVYRNPARKNPENPKKYVPQYQLEGVEPMEYRGFTAPPGVSTPMAQPSTDNPRAPRAAVRQPYAESVQSPIGRGRGSLPNVGNNIEQTWSSVDNEEIVDDIYEQLDPNAPMVDNNEFVSAAALRLPEEMVMEEEELPQLDEVATPPRKKFTANQPKPFLTAQQLNDAVADDGLTEVIKQLEDDEYLLLVEGHPICSGPMDYVQEQTRLLIFGEHELYNGNPVSADDIIVIKKTKIKVGVFLD